MLVDGVSVGAVSSYTFSNVTANHTIQAVFKQQLYTMTVVKAGSGSGTVTDQGNALNCGATCASEYPETQEVILTATPDAGSIFGGWSGACSGTSPTCTVVMTQAQQAQASFIRTWAIASSASAGGSISPSGATTVNQGDSASFAITANTGYHIANVLVDGVSVGPVASYTFSNVSAAHTISASFAVDRNILSVAAAGTGGGTITSVPVGINCGANCSASFDYGTSVTMTAVPDSTSVFAGWSGNGCSGLGTCTVSMTAAASVTATFTRNSITVSTPNGGETWSRRWPQTIRWSFTGSPDSAVRIDLYKGGVFMQTIASSVSIGANGTGAYNWTIPSKQTQGSDYAIRISGVSNSGYNDSSDGYFSITK